MEAAVIIDQTHIDLAEMLNNDYSEYVYEIQRKNQFIGYHELAIGDAVTFTLEPRRNRNLFHAKDLDDLLRFKSALLERPAAIVVQDLDFISFHSKDVPAEIATYFKLCDFLAALLDLGVLERRIDEDLYLFFASGTLLMKARTTGGTLRQNARRIVQGIDRITEILSDDLHKNDKVRLLKAVMYDSWRTSREDERLTHFLRHCREIAKNFSNNYELFVSEFSFDSEYEQLLREQHEFSGRLSAILTSIQGRILAIPLSLILAFGQMKTAPEDNPLLVNTGILIAAAVFAVLMWILLGSQSHVLLGLKDEIDSKVERYRVTSPHLFQQVQGLFSTLDEQFESTKRMLTLLRVLIIIGLIVTVLAWAYLTPEVGNAIAE